MGTFGETCLSVNTHKYRQDSINHQEEYILIGRNVCCPPGISLPGHPARVNVLVCGKQRKARVTV